MDQEALDAAYPATCLLRLGWPGWAAGDTQQEAALGADLPSPLQPGTPRAIWTQQIQDLKAYLTEQQPPSRQQIRAWSSSRASHSTSKQQGSHRNTLTPAARQGTARQVSAALRTPTRDNTSRSAATRSSAQKQLWRKNICRLSCILHNH